MPSSIAEVYAHGRVMRYRRMGAGPPLVALGPVGDLEVYVTRFRVIVPDMPDPGEDLRAWLAAFLEGLGTPGITIVAAGPFHAAARDLALGDPGRVSNLLLGGG